MGVIFCRHFKHDARSLARASAGVVVAAHSDLAAQWHLEVPLVAAVGIPAALVRLLPARFSDEAAVSAVAATPAGHMKAPTHAAANTKLG